MASKPIESTGDKSQQDYIIPTLGDIDPEAFHDRLETVHEFNLGSLAEAEKFYDEPVLVEIPKSSNPNEDIYIQLGVNGTIQPLLRGQAQWIKRRFLEVLVRAQPTTLETVEEIDPRTGNKAVRLVKTTGEKYPYRILQDNNPRGYAWLQNLKRQQS